MLYLHNPVSMLCACNKPAGCLVLTQKRYMGNTPAFSIACCTHQIFAHYLQRSLRLVFDTQGCEEVALRIENGHRITERPWHKCLCQSSTAPTSNELPQCAVGCPEGRVGFCCQPEMQASLFLFVFLPWTRHLHCTKSIGHPDTDRCFFKTAT